MKSGNLNFLEPSGPLQACNGTALTFFIYTVMKVGQNVKQGKQNWMSSGRLNGQICSWGC